MARADLINRLMALISLGIIIALFGVSRWVGWTPWVLTIPLVGFGLIWTLAGQQDHS